MPDWSLHYHRTVNAVAGTKELNVYTLRYDGETLVTMFIPSKERWVATFIARVLTSPADGHVTEFTPKELTQVLGILHGPWTSDNILHLSPDDAKTIRRALFHLGAEKHTLAASYENIRRDFAKLAKRNELLEQEVLRLRGRLEVEVNQSPQIATMADLLEHGDDDHPNGEFQFQHASQTLCARGGCAE